MAQEGVGPLCWLLECLIGANTVPRELAKRPAALGFNLDGLRLCLKEYCAGPRPVSIERPGASSERLERFLAELSPQAGALLKELAQEQNEGL